MIATKDKREGRAHDHSSMNGGVEIFFYSTVWLFFRCCIYFFNIEIVASFIFSFHRLYF